MIQQRPLPRAVPAARQENLERVVSSHPDASAAAMAQQRLHLRVPLGMRGAAKAEAVCEEAAPIITIPVGVCEPLPK